jgi:hypothetical protein
MSRRFQARLGFRAALLQLVIFMAAACVPVAPQTPAAPAEPASAAQPAAAGADLAAVKEFAAEHGAEMKKATAALTSLAAEYYALLESYGFDYEAAWAQESSQLTELLAQAKEQWLQAHRNYELAEAIVAGVPSLSHYDVWIDAGPSAAEDPAEALDWQLELADGRVLDKPGNIFHSLLEPALWGTIEESVGLHTDLNGDGEMTVGEALPETNLFAGAAEAMDTATAEIQTAIEGWEPSFEDTFTALVTMLPTMNEYFEQWKLSTYVAGADAEETSFVAISRLFDVNGILTGLDVTYDNISPAVAEVDADLDGQIQAGFDQLVGFVGDLYEQEQGGKVFSAEEADLFGGNAQEQATLLVGQVAQAAALLGVEIAE